MGILDDAIREHLELKRKHGVPEEEVQRQQEEALGPARRDVAQQHDEDAEGAAATAVEETPVEETSLFDGEHAPAEAAEPAAAAEAPTTVQPPDSAEPPESAEPAEPAPAPEAAHAPPTDAPHAHAPVPDTPHADASAPDTPPASMPPPAEPDAESEPVLADEPLPAEPEPLPEERPPVEPVTEPAAAHEDEPSPAPTTDDALGDTEPHGFPAVDEEDDELQVEEDLLAADPEDDELDVLEDTPDFLQETPEHDRLWFEQKPPRDFDFD